jgi:hypothetical protein
MMYCPRCGAQYGGPGMCTRCNVPVQYAAGGGYAPPRRSGCGGNGCVWAIVALIVLGLLGTAAWYFIYFVLAR